MHINLHSSSSNVYMGFRWFSNHVLPTNHIYERSLARNIVGLRSLCIYKPPAACKVSKLGHSIE